MCGGGACMVGEHACQGGVHGWECAWQGGMHGRGVCVAGGMRDRWCAWPRGHVGWCAWQGGYAW